MHVRACDHVEQHIDTGSHCEIVNELLPVFVTIVDGAISPKLLAETALFVCACRRDHGTTKRFCQLDSRCANATGTAVHEKRFPGHEPAAHEYVVPDRKISLRNCSRGNGIERCRNWQAMSLIAAAILGVTTPVSQSHDTVARLPARDSGAFCNNLPGNFEARQRARIRGHRVHSAALQTVGAINACRGHADEYLILRRLRSRGFDQLEHIGTARLFNADRLHGFGNIAHTRIVPQ